MKKLFFIMAFLAGLTHAQTIEFVVSASAGGPNDTVTRKIADAIEQNSNLKIVVTNKPGGAHTVAYNYVVTSNKPTLIMETPQIENHEVFSQMDEM